MRKKFLIVLSISTILSSSVATTLLFKPDQANNILEILKDDKNVENQDGLSGISKNLGFYFGETDMNGSDAKVKYDFVEKPSISSDDALKAVKYINNNFVVDNNYLIQESANNQIISLMNSNEFINEMENAYIHGLFKVENDNHIKYVEEDQSDGLKEISQSLKVNTASLGISSGDFKTKSHWYWFGYKKLIMSKAGREWYLTSGAGKDGESFIKATITTLGSIIKKIYKIVKKANIRALIVFIVIAITFLAVNITTLVLSYNALTEYSGGAYLGYISWSGTITNWGKN